VEPSASAVLSIWERGLRQSPGERALSLLALCEEVPDAPDRLPAGARDAALLRVRQRLFGDRIEALVACDGCAEQLDFTLSVASLLPGEAPAAAPAISIELEGCRVDARLPTAGDLAALRDARDLADGVSRLLRRCVLRAERDGRALRSDELDPRIYAALDEAFAAADPGGDLTLSLTCPACGAANRPLFDAPSLLWRETEQLAHDALLDVHELARAYGWPEAEILALSPARRAFYLEAVDA
jgi:hypothetical protein